MTVINHIILICRLKKGRDSDVKLILAIWTYALCTRPAYAETNKNEMK